MNCVAEAVFASDRVNRFGSLMNSAVWSVVELPRPTGFGESLLQPVKIARLNKSSTTSEQSCFFIWNSSLLLVVKSSFIFLLLSSERTPRKVLRLAKAEFLFGDTGFCYSEKYIGEGLFWYCFSDIDLTFKPCAATSKKKIIVESDVQKVVTELQSARIEGSSEKGTRSFLQPPNTWLKTNNPEILGSNEQEKEVVWKEELTWVQETLSREEEITSRSDSCRCAKSGRGVVAIS